MRTVIAIIPARYMSSRFPGKPLALINGKPMIEWVYQSVSKVDKLDAVYVATDDARIIDAVTAFGGKALMTSANHTCGTERLAECARVLDLDDEDIILNIQGDEPLVSPEMVSDLLGIFDSQDVYMGTLKKRIDSESDLNNPNVVKVVCNVVGDAIYFSRCAIPYMRVKGKVEYFKHIGVYGYKKRFLLEFSDMDRTALEETESLEQLRVIEHGYRIRVKETKFDSVGVDTPEQIYEVERLLGERTHG